MTHGINPVFLLLCSTKKMSWSNIELNTSCQTAQLPHVPSLVSEIVTNIILLHVHSLGVLQKSASGVFCNIRGGQQEASIYSFEEQGIIHYHQRDTYMLDKTVGFLTNWILWVIHSSCSYSLHCSDSSSRIGWPRHPMKCYPNMLLT